MALTGAKVTELAKAVVTIASRGAFNPDWSLRVLQRLYEGFTASYPGNFTTLHPILVTVRTNESRTVFGKERILNATLLCPFVQYCVSIGQPQYAHEWVLSQRLVDANKRISPLTATDIIEYYYAGAQAYLQMHAYREAEEYLEAVSVSGSPRAPSISTDLQLTRFHSPQCVTAPAQVSHSRLSAAIKRLVLVQLLKYGEVRTSLFRHQPASC